MADSFTPVGPDPQQQKDDTYNKLIDIIRPWMGQAGGAIVGGATAMIPGVGETGVAPWAAGLQGYALTDAALDQLKRGQTHTLGQSFSQGEVNAMTNWAANKVFNGMFRMAGAWHGAGTPDPGSMLSLQPTASQVLKSQEVNDTTNKLVHWGINKIGTVASWLEDLAPGAQKAAAQGSGQAADIQALALANRFNGRPFVNKDPSKLFDNIKSTLEDAWQPGIEGGETRALKDEVQNMFTQGDAKPLDRLRDIIDNREKLVSTLKLGDSIGEAPLDVKNDLKAFNLMDAMARFTKVKNGQKMLDADALGNWWKKNGEEGINDILYNGQGEKDVMDKFLKNISTTQQAGTPGFRLRPMWFLPGGFGIAGSILSGIGMGHAAATISGLYIGANVMGRMLANKEVGQYIANLASGELGTAGKIGGRALANSLEGYAIATIGPDGKKTPGSFQKDESGEPVFVPFKPH